jgi:gas vesicle protein
MSTDQFLSYWYKGAAVVGVIVGAVAALLLAIIATARSIQANAERIISVAEEIVSNTQALWKLAETDTVASEILSGAKSIEEHVAEVADALDAPRTGAT